MSAAPDVSPDDRVIARLRRFALEGDQGEACELCGAPLASTHTHLAAGRRLVCACEGCAFLLDHGEQGRYLRVPARARSLPEVRLGDESWEALCIPIGLAFFLRSSTEERVIALYPGPGGATECALSLEAWRRIQVDNPALENLLPDVEALLVDRRCGRERCLVVPIDRCYELVGLIRTRWRGLSGGTEVDEAIDAFFETLEVLRA